MKEEMLEICKILLPKDIQISNDLLSLYIDIIYQRILNYCRRNDFPDGLKYTACQMVVELIVENQTTLSDNSRVSSISEGDRTVSFNTAGVVIQADEKISKKSELNEYRKLYRT